MCSAGHWRKKGAERVDANAKVLARRDFELIGENSLKTKTKNFRSKIVRYLLRNLFIWKWSRSRLVLFFLIKI